jgi:uncharacterized phage protein (TIGR01671 family)
MTREIKFRSWNVDDKIMHDIAMPSWNGSHEVWKNNEPQTKTIWLSNGPVNEGILMQFTGRYDAEINGNEVYECDIIVNCDTKALQVVYWDDDKSAWYCQYVGEKRIVSLTDSLGNLNKVIGNIFENPELLK